MASECARADVAEDRRVWRTSRQPRMRRQPGRLVFIDETSVNTKMTPLRGRSLKGQRLKAKAPFGHWGTQTFIAALRCDGLTAPWIIDKAMNRAAFDTYVETQLAPTLQKGVVGPKLRFRPLRRTFREPACWIDRRAACDGDFTS